MVFSIFVKGSKGTLYLTLAGGPKIMATVEEMMVVRARTTLTGTILQRVYSSEEQCFFSRNFNHDNVARLCIDQVTNKKSLYFLPQMWIGHLLTCLLTEPKEGLWPALYERWKRVRGRNRGTTEQQACKTVCQFIIKMGPRARLLSTTCLEPGNYRTTMLKTLWVASAFSSF